MKKFGRVFGLLGLLAILSFTPACLNQDGRQQMNGVGYEGRIGEEDQASAPRLSSDSALRVNAHRGVGTFEIHGLVGTPGAIQAAQGVNVSDYQVISVEVTPSGYESLQQGGKMIDGRYLATRPIAEDGSFGTVTVRNPENIYVAVITKTAEIPASSHISLTLTSEQSYFVLGQNDFYECASDELFEIWRSNFGRTVIAYTDGDLNGDGRVTAADYTVWADLGLCE